MITGNITYINGTGGTTDVLGLIATNFVQVYHPIDGNGNDLNGTLSNPQINAAIVALTHSFIVPNWAGGDPSNTGTLNVTGAIAQMYRGPVGTHNGSSIASGYAKNYTYDTRLKYLSPPHFIDPVASAWAIKVWAEAKPSYPAPTCSPTVCP
jgi:hypothetical protein